MSPKGFKGLMIQNFYKRFKIFLTRKTFLLLM